MIVCKFSLSYPDSGNQQIIYHPKHDLVEPMPTAIIAGERKFVSFAELPGPTLQM
jgi:hypothetical protein